MCVCGLVLTDRRRGVEFGDLAGLKLSWIKAARLAHRGVD